MSTTTTASTTTAAAKKTAKNLPALVKTDSGSQIVPISTKAGGVGRRLMTKFEFRRVHNLSRSQTETQFAAYFEANAKEFSAQTADRINRGQLFVHSVTAGKGGSITLKAKASLPKAQEVTETKAEKKVMGDKDAMATLGITPEMLAMMKAMVAAKAPAAPAAEGKTLEDVLAEAKAEAVTAEPAH